MNCKHPIDISIKTGSETMTVHRSRKIDGKRVSRPDMPFVGRASYLVPCGKCLACKSRRKSEMTFRMDCEKRHGHLLPDGSVRRYKHCFFCTLTYADRMLPRFTPLVLDHRTGEVYDYVEVPEDHKGILNPLHLAEFMKRLRRYYDLDCKVFWCGEYGDDGQRPHYHCIFYSDMDWQHTVNAFRRAWSFRCPVEMRGMPGSFMVKDGKYKTWRFSFGRVDVKPVNMRRVRYCAKYVVKDTDTKQPIPKFARVSKHLGTGWLLSSEARSVVRNKSLFAYTVDGRRASIGRYFTHRIFTKADLRNAVDAYLFEFENPPENMDRVGVRMWYDEHLAQKNALYRSALARAVIPRLSYV